jgi:hypothetical protein
MGKIWRQQRTEKSTEQQRKKNGKGRTAATEEGTTKTNVKLS